jgi:hypothetical protein
MAYSSTNRPFLVAPAVAGGAQGSNKGGNIWIYRSTDPIATVVGSYYFQDGKTDGMQVSDVVIVVDTATPEVTTCVVTAVTAGYGATVVAESVAGFSGTLAISHGGTGQTTKAAAFNALSPLSTAGDIVYGGSLGAGTVLAAGTSSQVLVGGTTPSWGAVNLSSGMVSGSLPYTSVSSLTTLATLTPGAGVAAALANAAGASSGVALWNDQRLTGKIQSAVNSSNYIFGSSDAGYEIVHSDTVDYTWIIPAYGTTPFTPSEKIGVTNFSSGTLTIASSLIGNALYLMDGATTSTPGNRTLAAYTQADLTFMSTDKWSIRGIGVS